MDTSTYNELRQDFQRVSEMPDAEKIAWLAKLPPDRQRRVMDLLRYDGEETFLDHAPPAEEAHSKPRS